MEKNIYLYIAVMAGVSYLIRVLPLTLIRKPIKNQFIQSFLYYVPYVTLAVMTFPAILSATNSTVSAALALLPALQRGVYAAQHGAGAGHRNHRGVVRKKSPVRCGDLLCGGIHYGIFLSVVKIHKTHILKKTKAVSVSDHPSIK